MQVNNSHKEYLIYQTGGVINQWFLVGGRLSDTIQQQLPLKMVACHRNVITHMYSHCLHNRQNYP